MKFNCEMYDTMQPVGVVVKDTAIGAGGLGFGSRALKSDTLSPVVRHRCDVSSELCCIGAKLQRWTPSLVTRFGVILQVMKIF